MNFGVSRRQKEETIRVEKTVLKMQGMLKNKPCIFCEKEKGWIPSEDEKFVIKKEYADIRNHGFHCSDHYLDFHVKAGFEYLRWSCCVDEYFVVNNHKHAVIDLPESYFSSSSEDEAKKKSPPKCPPIHHLY